MSISKWQEWKQKQGGVTPLDIVKLSTEWIEEDESSKRFDICKSCPELIKLTKQCKQCGCFMAVKVKLKAAVCPIGKW